jgi:ubiquinone biosynthesis protein COQ9
MIKTQNNYLLKKRLEVLKLAKILVSKDGLKPNTLKTLSKKYNLNINETEILFPEGSNDLIKFALEQLNVDLEYCCKKIDLIRLPMHKRIRKILLLKISLMHKDKKFYKNIFINILILKKNIFLPKQLYKSIDQIWFIAGDTSTDFNFYTKRLILGGIYTRIALFFFNNNDQNELENILDTNLRRVSNIPKLKSKINIFKDSFPKILKFVKNFS